MPDNRRGMTITAHLCWRTQCDLKGPMLNPSLVCRLCRTFQHRNNPLAFCPESMVDTANMCNRPLQAQGPRSLFRDPPHLQPLGRALHKGIRGLETRRPGMNIKLRVPRYERGYLTIACSRVQPLMQFTGITGWILIVNFI